MALEEHLCGNNISKIWRNPIGINHFASIKVKKVPQIGFLDPPRAPSIFQKITKNCVAPSSLIRNFDFSRRKGQPANKIFSIHPNVLQFTIAIPGFNSCFFNLSNAFNICVY